MRIYFAPMEGVTGFIYRNAHHACYPGTDRYYTPFLSPNQNHCFAAKEYRDVLPDNNRGIPLVPQILTNRAVDFIWAAGELEKLGYREVNLNLGCPSATVVTKKKGAGFLAEPEKLDRFLDEIFAGTDVEISVKTRIGKMSPDEWGELEAVYNRYPIKELIVHPRIQTDFYKNHPNMEVFRSAVSSVKAPLCYNGDLFTAEDYEKFQQEFPNMRAVMLGRGLVANPALADKFKIMGTAEKDGAPETYENRERVVSSADAGKKKLMEFHERVYEGYREYLSGDKNVLFKMKELWAYMIHLFPGSEKTMKKIRKASRLPEYEAAAGELFRECVFDADAGYRG